MTTDPLTVNSTLKYLLCLLTVSSLLTAEDHIELRDGSTLRGTVRSIEGNEKVVVDSTFSSSPIELRGSALRSIIFKPGGNDSTDRQSPELLHLANGDILPGSLQGLDSKQVSFRTIHADELKIPRDHIRSIDFGVTPQKLVYAGPKPIADWIDNDDWEWENGKLTCDTSGTIAAENVLPRQFILRFRLEWESGPNFRLYFCDDFLKRTGNADRYYFEVNSMGSQLKRQTTEGGRRWHTLAQSHRRPQEYNGNSIDVELRVDRDRRQIYVYLDGEKLQRTPDPIDSFPSGTGIMLQSQAGGDLKNIISELEIYEWDAVTELRRNEGHDDPKTDGLVDVEGQHLSGAALQLEERDGNTSMIFASPFNEQPLKIRTTRISSLYFKHAPNPPAGQAPLQVDLRGGGTLQFSSLTLKEKVVEATHPLLGRLILERNAIERLAVTGQKSKPKGKEGS